MGKDIFDCSTMAVHYKCGCENEEVGDTADTGDTVDNGDTDDSIEAPNGENGPIHKKGKARFSEEFEYHHDGRMRGG